MPLFGNTFAAQKTYARSPVWRDSTTKPVRFAPPLTRRQARELVDAAEEWDISTREPGRHGGVIGTLGVRVLRALALKCLNFRTGRLDPGYRRLARLVGVCERSIATALARLQELGLLNWLRRAEPVEGPEGGFLIRQLTNAYTLLPCSQWKGYKPPPSSPPPEPTCWGAMPAVDHYAEAKAAGDLWGQLAALEAEAKQGSGIAGVHANVLRRRLLYFSAISETASPAEKPKPTFIQDMWQRR